MLAQTVAQTGWASEITMFNAQLNPNRNSANLVQSLEQLFSLPVFLLEGTNLFKLEEIGGFLKISEPYLALSFIEHYLKVHVNPRGMWGLEIVDRFTGQRNFYLGAGYQKGILSGSKPLSEWGLDPEGFYYFIEDFSEETLWRFYSETGISYPKMANLLSRFNSGK